MKVLVLGLVCIVWVQKACSAPKWSSNVSVEDDLTGYENGFCWMDCDWYDDPLYYDHKDLDPGLFFPPDHPFEYEDGFEDPGDFHDSDGNGTLSNDDDGGFADPGINLDSGSGAARGNGPGNGTSLDPGSPDPAPPDLSNTDDEDYLKDNEQDGTGLQTWKKVVVGLVAGTVLVKVLWKWVTDFVDSALEIPPDAGMERSDTEKKEFKVVWKPDGRSPKLDSGTELLRQSRFFHLLVRGMGVTDIIRELELSVLIPSPADPTGRLDGSVEQVVPERKPPQRISESPVKRISAAVRDVVITITPALKPAPTNHSLGNDLEFPSGTGHPNREVTKQARMEVLELPPPKDAAPVGISPKKKVAPVLEKGVTGPQLEKTRILLKEQFESGRIEKSPPATGEPWAKSVFPRQPTISAAEEAQSQSKSSLVESPEKISVPDIGGKLKHRTDIPLEKIPIRDTLHNSVDSSGKVVQDEEELVMDPSATDAKDDNLAGASFLIETTKGTGRKRMWWRFGCFKITRARGVKSGPSNRSKNTKVPSMRIRSDLVESQKEKKATKKKYWLKRIFKLTV